jgi:hypothetical protein
MRWSALSRRWMWCGGCNRHAGPYDSCQTNPIIMKVCMRVNWLISVGFIVLALLSGANVSYAQSIPDERLGSAEFKVHVIISQDEIFRSAQLIQTALIPSGGGLFGTGMHGIGARQKSRMISPLFPMIDDIDYREYFAKALKNFTLGTSAIDVSVSPRELNSDEIEEMRLSLHENQVLMIVRHRYFFPMNCRTIDSIILVDKFIKKDSSDTTRAISYYQSRQVGADGESATAIWGANNAALFRSAVMESITETLKLIIIEMGDTSLPPIENKKAIAHLRNSGAKLHKFLGRKLVESDDRVIIIDSNKNKHSLPKYHQSADDGISGGN